LVTPRLDAGLGPPAALFAQAFHRAIDLYGDTGGAVVASGALHLATAPDDPRRFAKIAGSDLFDPARIRPSEDTSADGLILDDALVVDPAAILSAWLGTPIPAKVAAVVGDGEAWRLDSEGGETLGHLEIVVLAAGVSVNDLASGLDLRAVRGQASLVQGSTPATAVLFGGYAVPTRDGLMFGATHDRDDLSLEVRDADHARNRATLAAALPDLAAKVADRATGAHVGIRATTRDFLPLAGAVDADRPGLFVLSGLGSRGFCLAPLLAEHVAALALGLPSPLPGDIAALVDPGRLAKRDRSRGRSRPKPANTGKQSA
jgi:tRNA 5-methylaminomethyl-2-thiouridine biosynthesis bifunctional protein